MTKTASCRVILAGTGAAATIPADGTVIAFRDPMLGAIDRHRAAYLKQMASGAVQGALNDDTPEHTRATTVWDRDNRAALKAARELLDMVPRATLTGLMVLIDYAEAFNAGALFLPDDEEYGHSAHSFWPIIDEIEYDDGHGGASFAWALIANIRKALQSHVGKVVAS